MTRRLVRVLPLAFALRTSLAAAQESADAPPSAPSEAPAPAAPAEAPPPEASPTPPPADPPPAEAAPAPAPAPSGGPPSPPVSAAPPPAPPPTATFESPPPATKAAAAAAAPAAAAGADTSPPSPASSSPAKSDDTSSKDDTDGLLGPFRIGPVVGVGLPSLINVGGVIKLTRYFAAGLNIGIAPDVKFAYYGEATVSYHAYQIYGHLHPFGGGFYLGASVGYALARGKDEQTVALPAAIHMIYPSLANTITLKSEGSVQTMVLTPELGYFKTWKAGFSLGLGVGLQLPIASSDVHFDQDVNADVPAEVLKQYLDPTAHAVKDTLERVGQAIIPTVGISVGWLL